MSHTIRVEHQGAPVLDRQMPDADAARCAFRLFSDQLERGHILGRVTWLQDGQVVRETVTPEVTP